MEQVQQAATLTAGSRDEVDYLVQLADLYVTMGNTVQTIATYQRALEVDRWRLRSDYIEEQLERLSRK